jgi:nucleoside-diphosphate-sugar epimerase
VTPEQEARAKIDVMLYAAGWAVQDYRAFNPSAEEMRAIVLEAFPGAALAFQVDEKRQGIVDSWPADVNDAAARRDWGFAPRFDLETAFTGYLIPTIRDRYRRA